MYVVVIITSPKLLLLFSVQLLNAHIAIFIVKDEGVESYLLSKWMECLRE